MLKKIEKGESVSIFSRYAMKSGHWKIEGDQYVAQDDNCFIETKNQKDTTKGRKDT